MARRKITEKGVALADIAAASDLPELTASQRLFVEGLLSGKTASDAYRSAYDCAGSAPNSIWCEASKLRNNPHVAQWLFAARLASLDTGRITLEGHTAELARLREIAIDSGNVGAAVQAEHMRGKASGLYVERYEIDHFHHDPASILELIAVNAPGH